MFAPLYDSIVQKWPVRINRSRRSAVLWGMFQHLGLSLTRDLFALTIPNMTFMSVCRFFAGFFRPDHDPPCGIFIRACVSQPNRFQLDLTNGGFSHA
jgi:hypothetical protein